MIFSNENFLERFLTWHSGQIYGRFITGHRCSINNYITLALKMGVLKSLPFRDVKVGLSSELRRYYQIPQTADSLLIAHYFSRILKSNLVMYT